MAKKDLQTLNDMLEALREVERAAMIDLGAPVRRSMLITMSDLRRTLEGVEKAHRTEHVAVHGTLPGEVES